MVNSISRSYDDHGILYKFLLGVAIINTLFLASFLKPHRFYKRIISAIFNAEFKFRGVDWKVYHIMGFYIFLLSLLLLCNLCLTVVLKMQVNMFIVAPYSETHEKRVYRLTQKWLVESELWLVFLTILELV